MARILGVVALAIFFIWGQGFAAGWIVFTSFVLLILLVLINKLSVLQWVLGLFLLGVTLFASPTFGYSESARKQYNCGYSDGRMAYNLGGISDTIDDWWDGHVEDASNDISGYKKYYVRGFKRALAGRED